MNSKEEKICPYCNKKISIWTDTERIEHEGRVIEICEDCFERIRKEMIKEMKESQEGRMELYHLGSHLIKRGLFWTIIGIIITVATFYFIAVTKFPIFILFWGLIVYGIYDLFRGLYYKLRYKENNDYY